MFDPKTDRPVTSFCTCHMVLMFGIPLLSSPKVRVEEKMSAIFPIGIRMIMNISFWDNYYAHVRRKEGCLSLHSPSIMALRDRLWPCKIIFGLAEIDYGLARSIMALRDQLWPCEINYGLARSIMALRDHVWPCQHFDGLARWPIALWEGP